MVYKHAKFQTNPKIKAAISLLNKVSLYVSSIVLLTWAISMGTSTIKSGSCIAILIRMIRIVYFPAVWMGLQRPAFHLQRFCQQLKEHRRKKNSHIACNIHQISLQTRLCFQTTRLTCIFECFLGRSFGQNQQNSFGEKFYGSTWFHFKDKNPKHQSTPTPLLICIIVCYGSHSPFSSIYDDSLPIKDEDFL